MSSEARRIIKEANKIVDKARKKSEWFEPSAWDKFRAWCMAEVSFRNISVLLYTSAILGFIIIEWSLYNG